MVVRLANIALKSVFLIAILIMSFAITSSLARGQTTANIQTTSTDSTTSQGNNMSLKDVLDQRYLGLLGDSSNATQISSTVNSTDDVATKGYSYMGNFTSSNRSYLVESTQYEITNGNQTILTTTQRISGSTNSYCFSTENKTTINNVILSQDDLTMLASNCSGNYQLTMHSVGNYDADTSAPISVQAELDQNFFGPVGNYSIALSPLQDNASEEDISAFQSTPSSVSEPEMDLTITSPDGVQSTGTLVPNSLDGQSGPTADNSSPLDSGLNGPLGDFTVPVPSPLHISFTLFNPLLYYQNSNMLTGFFIYWDKDAGDVLGAVMTIAGIAAGALTLPTMGVATFLICTFISVTGVVLALSAFFQASLSGENINIMYCELEFYLLWGIFPVPYYLETGYYTNQVDFLGSISWTFFDVFDNFHSYIPYGTTMVLYSHTGVWPAGLATDSEVTFRAVDASGNQIDNVGFEVDGSWNFYSGESYWLPARTHSVYAANPGGALNWIDQDGHGLNGRPVTLTISGDTTITAHYYHWITIQLGCVSTISAMAWSAALDFQALSNYTLGDGNPTDDYIATVELNNNSNFYFTDDAIYALVALGSSNGGFDVGLVDKPPTDAEWASMHNLQLYAVGYGGDPNSPFNASELIWMVTNNLIYVGNIEDQAVGLFVSWARSIAMQNQDQYHNPDEMAGGPVLDSNLVAPPTGYPLATQTQSYPTGVPNFNDITYFVGAYINYNVNQVYNPYADLDANGYINFNDISLFVGNYIAYYCPSTQKAVVSGNQGLATGLGNLGQTASLNLDGPSVLPCVGSSFNVTLNVSNVSDLWAWGTGLQWNPGVLELTKITEGPFLAQGGSTIFLDSLGNSLVLSNGTLQDMGDALFSSSGVSGSGTLATLTFQVLSGASVNVTLIGSELESPYTGNGIQQIPFTASNLQIQLLTYSITAASDAHSAISPVGTTHVDYGASQTYTMTAATGYQIAHVYVDGVDQGAITSYTFSDVTANHTISVLSTLPYIFSDNFESGNLDKWSVVEGYPYLPSVSSAEAHTGTHSVYFPASSGETNEELGTDFSPQSTVDVRFYLYLSSLSESCPLLVRLFASNYDQISVSFDSATRQFALDYYNNNDDCDYYYVSAAQHVTANAWFCLEIALTPTTFTLYYNGVSILTGVLIDGPTGQFSNVYFQSYTWAGSVPAFYIDDVVVSTGYIGP